MSKKRTSNAITLDEILSTVRDLEIEVAHLSADLKTSRAALEAAKLPSYCNVLGFLGSNAGTDLEAFGKFWTLAFAGSFKSGLQAKGVSKACAKRLAENSVNAFKANADLRAAACEGAASVGKWLEANKIGTESAIRNLGGKTGQDEDEAISLKLSRLPPERFSKIVKRVAVLQEIATRKTNGPNGVSKPKAVAEEIASE